MKKKVFKWPKDTPSSWKVILRLIFIIIAYFCCAASFSKVYWQLCVIPVITWVMFNLKYYLGFKNNEGYYGTFLTLREKKLFHATVILL